MQSLTGTLLAAQKKARAKPYAEVMISDRIGPQARYHWTKLYSDATDDYPHAMVVCDDHSVVRAMSLNGSLRMQRITDPEDSDHWDTWSGQVDTCSVLNQISLCTAGTKVWCFYISTSDLVLYCRESNDSGASFGGRTAVHTCAGDDRLESVTSAHRADTYAIVFYSVDDTSAQNACDLYKRRQDAGGWQGATNWGKTNLDKCRGLTCHKTGDYNMLFGARIDAEPYGFEPTTTFWCLQAVVFGAGVDVTDSTWSNPVIIERTDAGSAFAHAWPSLTYVDTFRMLNTGYLIGEEYSRVVRSVAVHAVTFMETEWSDYAPFYPEGGPFGMALDYMSGGDGYVYASCSNAAYRAASAGLGTVTFTTNDRVKKYEVRDRWGGHKAAGLALDYGQLVAPDAVGEIWLDNSDGALNSLGTGTYDCVLRGSMVELERGYIATDGHKEAPWPTMWLEDYEHVVDFQGRCYVVLHCISGWGILSTMTAQRQYHWQDGDDSVWSIAERLFALAGFDLSSDGEASAVIGTLEPALVIHPGQDLRGAVLQALSKVPDFVFFEQDTPYVKELADDEASDYTYGGSGEHVIIAGRYGVRTPANNHIEVFAALDSGSIPTFGDEVDYEEVALVGHRLQKVYDYSYTTDAECDARAVAQLRKHDATTKRGEIITLPNVGLQLFDVITVTDARAGISSEVYRVRGIVETFDTTKPPAIFRQKVELGAR